MICYRKPLTRTSHFPLFYRYLLSQTKVHSIVNIWGKQRNLTQIYVHQTANERPPPQQSKLTQITLTYAHQRKTTQVGSNRQREKRGASINYHSSMGVRKRTRDRNLSKNFWTLPNLRASACPIMEDRKRKFKTLCLRSVCANSFWGVGISGGVLPTLEICLRCKTKTLDRPEIWNP